MGEERTITLDDLSRRHPDAARDAKQTTFEEVPEPSSLKTKMIWFGGTVIFPVSLMFLGVWLS